MCLKELYYSFVDLENAFDRVPREIVRWALKKLGVDGWLIRTVMTLYTEACTMVGVHLGSVLSPLLFAIVMDVVSSEASSPLSELLYADDLVLMVPTMEQHGRRVAECRACLLDKGLQVNARKPKVMVGSNGGKVIVNSVKCTVCKRGFTSGVVVYVVTYR